MKDRSSLIVSVSNINDLEKITKETKYINIDITNPNREIIAYFLKHGASYMYSDLIVSTTGYNYVSYDDFIKAENIIDAIELGIPNNLNDIELARYLYINIGRYLSLDIDTDQNKTETNNLCGSLSLGTVTDISTSKIYYYLCRRQGIDISIVINEENKKALTKLLINNQVLITALYDDIPYIKCNMKTKHFANYNDDINIDKKIKYIKGNYNDYNIDKSLKDIDYMEGECVYKILNNINKIIDIKDIKPVELSIICDYIFNKYCPNYNIKINNLFLNSKHKLHFILISYNDDHYSYNYRKNSFIRVNDEDIIDDISVGKIGVYLNESIPNINYSEFMRRNC